MRLVLAVLVVVGLGGVAAALDGPSQCLPPQCAVVTVTSPTTTVPSSGGGGEAPSSAYHWKALFYPEHKLCIAGIFCSSSACLEPAGYGDADWGFWLYELYGPGDELLARKGGGCGPRNAANVPAVPPSPEAVGDLLKAQGLVKLQSIQINPATRGLTGVASSFSVSITNPSPITVAADGYVVTATLAPSHFSWDIGEQQTIEGQTPDVIFSRSGTHRVVVTVRFSVTYQISGPVSLSAQTSLLLSAERDYDVIEIRGVLSQVGSE